MGDVILSLDGKPIIMSADLPHLVGSLKDGEKARLEIIRNGKRQNLDVTIGALPDEDQDVTTGANGGVERSSNRLGVSVADLTAEQKRLWSSRAAWSSRKCRMVLRR